ncbi:hypothetical protein K503DRAFT_776425 [Rhizopogon vinicolor AM-OR11-026]|uniref:Uncharacterized protein n=1 Tax=Rhizopogon vinicolor AM-OR11-026 TaxID=1314800 RepID=A0A1B7MJA7_9AGAM|nr:hypothetical protein K503DRAFT_776425 [Rhizopogon vinicolor AM-OR11-026]
MQLVGLPSNYLCKGYSSCSPNIHMAACRTDRYSCCQSNDNGEEGEMHYLY